MFIELIHTRRGYDVIQRPQSGLANSNIYRVIFKKNGSPF